MTKTINSTTIQQVSGHLFLAATLAVWFLAWMPFARAADQVTYTWAELKAADGKSLAEYRAGQPVLFCFAYRSKAVCEVAATPPVGVDCVSAHTPNVPGQWIALGDIPGVEAVKGDGKVKCHGRTIPAGQWWGVNLGYKPLR